MTTENQTEPSADACQELQKLYDTLKPFYGARLLWNRVLDDRQRKQLGGNAQEAHRKWGTIGMVKKLWGVSRERALIEVGHRIGSINRPTYMWLLREIGEVSDPEKAIQQAIDSGALVLREDPRAAYWNGDMIEVDWYRQKALWNYLWLLAEKSKKGKRLEYVDFGDHVGPNYLSQCKHNLNRRTNENFPKTLWGQIESKSGAGQTLTLSPDMIRLFRADQSSLLSRICGSASPG